MSEITGPKTVTLSTFPKLFTELWPLIKLNFKVYSRLNTCNKLSKSLKISASRTDFGCYVLLSRESFEMSTETLCPTQESILGPMGERQVSSTLCLLDDFNTVCKCFMLSHKQFKKQLLCIFSCRHTSSYGNVSIALV